MRLYIFIGLYKDFWITLHSRNVSSTLGKSGRERKAKLTDLIVTKVTKFIKVTKVTEVTNVKSNMIDVYLGLVGQDIETLVTRPRVPSDPMNRCFRSYPVLSFFMLKIDRWIVWEGRAWKPGEAIDDLPGGEYGLHSKHRTMQASIPAPVPLLWEGIFLPQ